MRRRTIAMISGVLLASAIFSYFFVPFIYVGYNSPLYFSNPPAGSKVYASLTCAVVDRLAPDAQFAMRYLGTVDQGGYGPDSVYYLRCYPAPLL